MSNSSYSYKDGDEWHQYPDDACQAISNAQRAGVASVELPGWSRRFEVRFGSNARSAQMRDPPSTGMIQVNLETQATCIVRRDEEERRRSTVGSSRAAFDDYATDEEPLFGWLLRKQSKGWRKGSWQRRFFVLAPRSSALLYFTKGLHSRHVALCRDADCQAPQAKGTIFLKDAVIDPTRVDDDKPYSFTIRVPGAEYQLSARADNLKRKWLAQLDAVAKGEPLGGGGKGAMPSSSNDVSHLPQMMSAPPTRVPEFNHARPNFQSRPSQLTDPRLTMPPIPQAPSPKSQQSPITPAAPAARTPVTSMPSMKSVNSPDEVGSLFTQSLRMSTAAPAIKGGEAAEEHSECAVCFDELHARPVGVLLNKHGRRLCRHIFHLDCLLDLPGAPKPDCPYCRAVSNGVKALPNVVDDPVTWFELLDVDGMGRIEAEDVLKTLKSQLSVDEERLDANWDKIWDRFDLDHSGSLTYDELVDEKRGLLKSIKSIIGAGAGDDKKTRHAAAPDLTKHKTAWFEYWDDDGNGSLDEGELVRALVHSFNKAGRRDEVRAITEIVHALLAACDVEGDGLISREEFLAPETGLADVIVGNFGFFNSNANDEKKTNKSQEKVETAPPPAPPQRPPPPPPVPTAPSPPLHSWAVEIRTNGGSRYTTQGIGPTSTVGELRATAARMHNDMPPARVKLVNRGAQLRDDSITLAAAGVRDRDSLMLIVASGSRPNSAMTASNAATMSRPQSTLAGPPNSYQQQPPPPAYSSPQLTHSQSERPSSGVQAPPPFRQSQSYSNSQANTPQPPQCRVTVPGNAGPGSTLTIRAPTGETLRVVVPPGYFAGSSFTVQYNPGTNTTRYSVGGGGGSLQQPPTYNHTSQQQQPVPNTMRVKVPQGVGPGSTLTVAVPNVGHCRVAVPAGVYEGQYFEFRVPQRR